MKLTLKQPDLMQAVKSAASVVKGKSSLGITNNLLLQPSYAACSLTLTGTDLEQWVQSVCCVEKQADESNDDAVTVPASLLSAHVASIAASESITLEWEAGEATLKLTAPRVNVEIPILPAEMFPTPPTDEGATTFTMPCAEMVKGLSFVKRCISTDETRPMLTGLLLTASKDSVKFATTDTHRIGFLETSTMTTGDDFTPSEVVLPAGAASRLLEALSGTREVSAKLSNTVCEFTLPEVVITTRLLLGQFPNYYRIAEGMNGEYTCSFSLDRKEAIKATNRAALSTDIKERTQKIVIDAQPGKVVIKATGGSKGNAGTELETHVEGQPLTMYMSASILLDTLNSIPSERVVIEFIGQLRPFRVRASDGDMDKEFHICMSMQPV